MFEFIHDIIESWILAAASGGLGSFRRGLMQAHLKSCMRCRGFALDLVEFSHALEPEKKSSRLPLSDKEEIHTRIMAAFQREIRDERLAAPFQRAAGPLIRPSFIKAMAVLTIILGAAIVLSTPFFPTHVRGGDQASSDSTQAHEALLALEPSPTATPSIPKTENK